MPLLAALETAELPPKTRSADLGFVDAIRGIGRTVPRRWPRGNHGRRNVQELIHLAGDFHTARELLDHAALSTGV